MTHSGTGASTVVPLMVSYPSPDSSPPEGSSLELNAVTWTQVRTTTQSDTDALGIAWRVAVTPFAVAADVVLAIPLGLVGLYFLLTDPALLTGG
jgi:hypothetical protein